MSWNLRISAGGVGTGKVTAADVGFTWASGAPLEERLLAHAPKDEGVVSLDPAVEGAEGSAASQTVRSQQAIEGIPRPIQGKCLVDEAKEGDLVQHEPGVSVQGVQEPFVVQFQSSHLGEVPDLQEGNGRYAPGAVRIQPVELGDAGMPHHHPEHKMGVQEELHASSSGWTGAGSGTSSPSSPSQRQPHSWAWSASGTRMRCA